MATQFATEEKKEEWKKLLGTKLYIARMKRTVDPLNTLFLYEQIKPVFP